MSIAARWASVSSTNRYAAASVRRPFFMTPPPLDRLPGRLERVEERRERAEEAEHEEDRADDRDRAQRWVRAPPEEGHHRPGDEEDRDADRRHAGELTGARGERQPTRHGRARRCEGGERTEHERGEPGGEDRRCRGSGRARDLRLGRTGLEDLDELRLERL